MVSGFWKNLRKPIIALSPLAGITDFAFRQMLVECGKPDVTWTEFVSCAGLNSKSKEKLLIDLRYSQNERPIVAQIFGATPKNFYQTAQIIADLGFDGLDINLGCPDHHVQKQGAGAILMKHPKLAQEIIEAAKTGAGKLPVSIKTRVGYYQNDLETWLPTLLEMEVAAIIIHGRTRQDLWQKPANWDYVAQAVKIRDRFDNSPTKTLILGNGDIGSYATAMEKCRQTGADGALIGRAAMSNPWIFNPQIRYEEIPVKKKLRYLIKHAQLFDKYLTAAKGFNHFKKHIRAYANGFDAAKDLRMKLIATKNAQEIEDIVKNFLISQ